MTSSAEAVPRLRVVGGGEPTPDETAALVAAVAALAAGADEDAGRASRSAWTDRSAALRRPLEHGPGAWRRSARAGW